MKGYGSWLVLLALVGIGYYLYAVNPTPYEVVKQGSHTYRRSRFNDKWEMLTNQGWKETSQKPAVIDPGRRLGEVGIGGFQK